MNLALQLSIEHWERIAANKREPYESIGIDDCNLCTEYFHKHPRCYNCPVRIKTGQTHCYGSPYEDINKQWDAYSQTYTDCEYIDDWFFSSATFLILAEIEVAFLKSLVT